MVKKSCLSLVLILSVFFYATVAFADLAALSFTDTNSQTVTVGPAKCWINPTGAISLYLTAGLERKVGYVVLDGSGQTVAQGISPNLITAADQFTVLGQNYYGKVLTMPGILSEGHYTLRAQILDSAGNQVSSQDTAFTIALAPPTVGPITWYSWFYTGNLTGNPLVAGSYITYIKAQGVSSNIGIDHVVFQSFDPGSGSVYSSTAGWYDAFSGTVGIGNGNYQSPPQFPLPSINGPLGVRLVVYDKAGNQTAVQGTTTTYHGKLPPAPQLVAIYNPNVTTDTQFLPGSGLIGYVPYTPGMHTYANPMKLLYRLPITDYIQSNPNYGLSLRGGSVLYTDSTYVYVNFTAPYDASGVLGNSWVFLSPGWPSGYNIRYSLVLDSSAPHTPVLVSSQLNQSPGGWSSSVPANQSLWSFYNSPVSVSQIQVTAQVQNYDQTAYTTTHHSCTIPAGQTACTIDLNFVPPGTGTFFYQTNVQLSNADNSLQSGYQAINLAYDMLPPSITSYTINNAAKQVTFLIDSPQTGFCNYMQMITATWIMAHNTVTGQDVQVNGGAAAYLTGDMAQTTINYASLPEDNWQFTLWCRDLFGNTASQSAETVALDQTPPQIAVYREAESLADHGSVASLGQVRITLSDNMDVNPQLTSVRLTGGPQGVNVTLASRVQDGAYVLEYPVMFPSMGQEYSLVVSAKDASGNVADKTVPLSYAPPQINITSTGQETLNLPAIPANVAHPNGSNALSSGTITIGGATISGTYDLIVMSGSTSTTTIAIPGLSLAPGEQKTLPAHDFGATGGRLDIPVRADEPGRVDLLITSTAPNFPVIIAKLNFWRPQVQLSADPGWAVQPIIQRQRINMIKGAGTPCRLTADAQDAQAADAVNDPACLVQWTGLPANYQGTANYAEGVLPPAGDYTPGYEIYVFNNGQRYLMTNGSGQALQRIPVQDLAFTVQTDPAAASFYRKVQDVTVKLQSSGSYKCPAVAVTQAQAQEKGADQVVCLVRWVTLPDGMQAGTSTSGATAQLSGNLNQTGDQAVAWAVDLYSPYGMVENAVSGSATLSSVNPPLPELSFEAGLYGEKINDDLYITSQLQGGEVGTMKFGTRLLNTNMTLELDGTNEGHTSKQYTSSNNINFSRNLKTGDLGLWESRPVTMKLYYTNLPEVTVEKRITVVGVPSKRIKAVLTALNQTLDTTGVPVKLAVGVPGPHDAIIYNEVTDGAWRVRFGYVDSKNVFNALTNYQPLTNGVVETTLTGFQIGFQKLRAEVELTPPAGKDFYSRSLDSNMAYSTVLKGTAPEGQIYSRTLTGPAPLNTVMSLQVDSDTRRVMGSVVWQMSADNGASWQNLETKAPYQITTNINAGAYIVRAQMTNSLSGAVGYSEGVQLIAYKVPQLELSAPAAVIVGTPVTLKAQVTVDSQPVPAEDVIIEWYNRTGEKLLTGASMEITPADTASLLYTVQARMAAAPESDRSAWVRGNLYVRVVPPRPPTGLIAVPTYMEYNLVAAKTYVSTAKLNLTAGLDPAMYPVRGEWRLPDGSVVEGPELAYSPTAKDAEKRQALMEYVAWIEGFKEQTLATFRRAVTVGTYDWPEFRVDTKIAPEVAPSLVTLTATPESGYSGKLEKPAYAWQLPASAQLVREQDQGRVLQVNFPEAGSFEVGVTITDARGATGQASGTVTLGEPAPFQVVFAPLFSNSLHRELLDLTLRANVTGGHPQDRLAEYLFTINSPDAQVTSFTGSGIIKGLRAGDYTARLRALSKLGMVVEADYPISVIANQPPTCQVTTWEAGDYRWWKAACQDTDGRVAGYRWYQDDKLISSGQSIRVKKSDLTGTLRFEAIDDAQGTYSENLVGSAG